MKNLNNTVKILPLCVTWARQVIFPEQVCAVCQLAASKVSSSQCWQTRGESELRFSVQRSDFHFLSDMGASENRAPTSSCSHMSYTMAIESSTRACFSAGVQTHSAGACMSAWECMESEWIFWLYYSWVSCWSLCVATWQLIRWTNTPTLH